MFAPFDPRHMDVSGHTHVGTCVHLVIVSLVGGHAPSSRPETPGGYPGLRSSHVSAVHMLRILLVHRIRSTIEHTSALTSVKPSHKFI